MAMDRGLTREALTAPKRLEDALIMGASDEELASPWLRLQKVRAAEKVQNKLLDAVCGYGIKAAAIDAALAGGAWPDGDPLVNGPAALPCACRAAYEPDAAWTAAKLLLSRGAAPDGVGSGGRSTLHNLALRRASWRGDDDDVTSGDVAAWLLERGADASRQDARGRPPLFYALGPLARALFPATPASKVAELTGDADAATEGADDDAFAARTNEDVAIALLENAPAVALGLPDVDAVAARWVVARDEVEALEDTGGAWDQDRFDRNSARRSRNSERETKATLGAALAAAVAEAGDASYAETAAAVDAAAARTAKDEGANHLKAASSARARRKRRAELLLAIESYHTAAALFARAGDAGAEAVVLSNIAECALRAASVDAARAPRWCFAGVFFF